MRFIYDNQIDSLAASQITALTETTLYEATMVQDERLTTQWRSTAATDQTIVFNAGGTVTETHADQAIFQATTNLVTDPENLTSANWTEIYVDTTTSATILGYPAYEITANRDSGDAIHRQVLSSPTTTMSIVTTLRKTGTSPAASRVLFCDADTAQNAVLVHVTWATKAVTYPNGAEAISPVWIDDETVRLFLNPDDIINPSNDIELRYYVSTGTALTGQSVIATAPIVVDNTYPLGYTATSRAAWTATAGNVAYTIPPSGKFIVDTEVFPYFPYDAAVVNRIWEWFIDNDNQLILSYSPGDDAWQLFWEQENSAATLTLPAFDDGTALTINQPMRIVASMDLSTGTAAGSRVFMIPRSQGSLSETTAWSTTTQILSASGFSTLSIGHVSNVAQLDGFMSYLRIHGGTLTDINSTEAAIDAELATKQLTYSGSDYQSKFDVDTLAILGHTISAEADIKVELNDWDEWTYTDGSDSSIIRNTMTWDENTILTFLDSKVKRQYARFTINDPNNDNGDIRVGRFWVGDYLDISPSSLLDFKVTKQTSDRTIYGRNRQKWSDVGVHWRKFELQFPRTVDVSAQSMLSKIQRMYETVGNAKSVIFANFDTVRDYRIVEPVYASIVGPIAFNHRASQKYEYAITLEEDK